MDEKTKKILFNFCLKTNKKLFVMYGAAEATARMSILQWDDLKTKFDSIGKPLINCEFDLINSKGKKILKPNTPGELIFKGNNVFKGYAKRFLDLNKIENIQKLKTGDLGYFDNEGFYYIVGKKSRYIKLAGNRISLDEIEKILKRVKIDSICTQNLKDKIDVYINIKPKKIDIKDYISKKLNLNKIFFEIFLIKKFPRNKNNKINYSSKILKR